MAPGGGRQKNPVAYFYYTLPISCSENSRVYRRFSLLLQRHRWALGGGGQSWGACVAGAGWVFRRRCPFSKCCPVSQTRSGIEGYKLHWFLPRFAIFAAILVHFCCTPPPEQLAYRFNFSPCVRHAQKVAHVEQTWKN